MSTTQIGEDPVACAESFLASHQAASAAKVLERLVAEGGALANNVVAQRIYVNALIDAGKAALAIKHMRPLFKAPRVFCNDEEAYVDFAKAHLADGKAEQAQAILFPFVGPTGWLRSFPPAHVVYAEALTESGNGMRALMHLTPLMCKGEMLWGDEAARRVMDKAIAAVIAQEDAGSAEDDACKDVTEPDESDPYLWLIGYGKSMNAAGWTAEVEAFFEPFVVEGGILADDSHAQNIYISSLLDRPETLQKGMAHLERLMGPDGILRDDPNAQCNLGGGMVLCGRVNEAVEFFEPLVAEDGPLADFIDAQINYLSALIRAGMADKAIEHSGLLLAKGGPMTLDPDLHTSHANALIAANRFGEAVAYLEDKVCEGGILYEDPLSHGTLGRALMGQGDDLRAVWRLAPVVTDEDAPVYGMEVVHLAYEAAAEKVCRFMKVPLEASRPTLVGILRGQAKLNAV